MAGGRLIVFEGIDGCGKSTQVQRIAAARGMLATYEPGDTALGASLRTVVLDPKASMTSLAEALLLAADRAQHLAEVIEPALAEGRDVVCDRFSGSTIAYQGYGRGVPIGELRAVLEIATQGRTADLTVLLDCPVDVGRTRRTSRRSAEDRFDAVDAGFLERVRAGFLELATSELPAWKVIDASRSQDDVSRRVDAVLSATLD